MSSAATDDEVALVRAAARGDVTAFARIYDVHRAAVVRRLSHLVGPVGVVEDLAQDTFMRALRALPRFRGSSPLRHWLLRIATSVALDEHRRARRSLWRLFAEPDEIDEAPSPTGSGEAQADLAAVHRALLRLTERLRVVVVQFELEGQSLAEIADELGVPLHTVASRLRRGREQLRKILEAPRRAECAPGLPLADLALKERT